MKTRKQIKQTTNIVSLKEKKMIGAGISDDIGALASERERKKNIQSN